MSELTGAPDGYRIKCDRHGDKSRAISLDGMFVCLECTKDAYEKAQTSEDNPFLGLYDTMSKSIADLRGAMSKDIWDLKMKVDNLATEIAMLHGTLDGTIDAGLALRKTLEGPLGEAVRVKGEALTKEEVAEILRQHDGSAT